MSNFNNWTNENNYFFNNVSTEGILINNLCYQGEPGLPGSKGESGMIGEPGIPGT